MNKAQIEDFFGTQSYVITRLTLCILVVLFTLGLLNLVRPVYTRFLNLVTT